MIIPGFLIALLTFPGVIVHEIAHRLFCDMAKVPVYEVCYVRVGNPAGYVIHGPVNGLWSAFLIACGPFFINSFLCMLIAFPAVTPVWILHDSGSSMAIVHMFLLWLAISIGMHAFPSGQDLDNFHQQVKQTKGFNPLLVFSWILGVIFKIARLLSFFWFDAIYAVLIACILPNILSAV